MIGEKNHVIIPNNVQVGCKIDVQIPIVNMTRHHLHYYINIYDQQPKSDCVKSSSTSLPSIRFQYEGLEETEMESEKTGFENNSGFDYSDFVNSQFSETELENSMSSITMNTLSSITSIETTESLNVLKNRNYTPKTLSPEQSSFVFKFDEPTGELGPNEKNYLKLSFCPLKSVLYTVNVKCYVMCSNFQEIINMLPADVKGSGCITQLEVNIRFNEL